MFKSINFPEELVKRIQQYANKKHRGNYTAAVINLLDEIIEQKESEYENLANK